MNKHGTERRYSAGESIRKRTQFAAVALFVISQLWGATASATIRYVNVNSTNPAPPFVNWDTAATNIQDAVDAAVWGDEVLVSSGLYRGAGRPALDGVLTQVVVTNQLSLQSVSGASATIIDGGGTMRCVYMTNGAMLSGFTVREGRSLRTGGGIYCGSLSNEVVASCVIISNVSDYGGGINYGAVSNCIIAWNNAISQSGGGAESCQLNNCILSNNSAGLFGGGASGGISSLNNCVVIGNTARQGGGGVFGSTLNNCLVLSNTCPGPGNPGGTYECILNNCTICGNSLPGVEMHGGFGIVPQANNCIIYYNSGQNVNSAAPLRNCCTTPSFPGPGNITNAPLFANPAAGDFHLASNSPCINAGNNAYVTTTIDLDGSPRITGGTLDMGVYEFQNPASIISYAWLQQYGFPTDGSADFSDPDSDGMNNWQEWICGTDPTNAASVLKMLNPIVGTPGVAVPWLSVPNRNYFLQRATDLAALPSFLTVATNIPGHIGTTTFTDTNATGGGPFLYRVGTQR